MEKSCRVKDLCLSSNKKVCLEHNFMYWLSQNIKEREENENNRED
jgi:hypothetical protein